LSAAVGGSVVLFRPPGSEPPRDHEAATQGAVARLLAEVKGCEFAGTWDGACGYAGRLFFVPADTLLTDEAARLGIASPDDLFGGVVPYRFVKTKAISHGLPGPRAARPPGWSDAFTAEVAPAVLPGFTAFTRGDARAAACRLLEDGAIRIKPPLAAGSRGQRVAPTLDDVDEALAVVTESDLADCGVVLEANLADVSTLSVGKVTVDRLTVSYVGTQAETPDNEGRHVYGGSDLTVIRGGWEALDRLDVEPIARQAIAHAIAYDGATVEFPGFLASRRNYDVALGVDGRGRRRVGVLEASWRVGGASPGEIVALQELWRDPAIDSVRVSTVERYGEGLEVPADALVHFHANDAIAGPVLRYTRISERRPP
jgi:hypothetical protein